MPPQGNAPADYAEEPTQSMIQRKVFPMPALDRNAFIQDNYLGKKVHWYTRFFELNPMGKILGTYQLSFNQRGLQMPSTGLIYTQVHPGAHPELEHLRRGTRVDLWGTIIAVDYYLGVTLELDHADVLPVSLYDHLVLASERQV